MLQRLMMAARALSLFVTAILVAQPASAATIISTLNSVGVGDRLSIRTVHPNGTPIAAQVLVGLNRFTRNGGTETASLVGTGSGNGFLAFCIEPFQDVYLNSTYTYEMSPLANADSTTINGGLGAVKATQIAQLFGQFAPDFSAITTTQAVALQLAIWEIVAELSNNPFDVWTGSTYFTTPASSNFVASMNLAQTYLDYVSTATSGSPQAQGLMALTNGQYQDMIVQVVSAAPEPATWMTMILGFGLVGYALRRRGKATQNPSTILRMVEGPTQRSVEITPPAT